MKNFLEKHKMLVIIILAILIAGANYLVYPWFVKNRMELVEIPIAKQTITEGTKITEDMITTISTDMNLLPHGICINKDDIAGMYVNSNYTIPADGFIYAEMLSSETTAMGSTFIALDEDKTAYTIKVDAKYNVNSSLKVGQYINIYYYEETTNGVFGMLDEKVKIVNLDNRDQYTLVSLALDNDEVALYATAQTKGLLLPLLNYDSNSFKPNNHYYDIDSLRQYIMHTTDVYTSQSQGHGSAE